MRFPVVDFTVGDRLGQVLAPDFVGIVQDEQADRSDRGGVQRLLLRDAGSDPVKRRPAAGTKEMPVDGFIVVSYVLVS